MNDKTIILKLSNKIIKLEVTEKEFENFKKFNDGYIIENELLSNQKIILKDKNGDCRFCEISRKKGKFTKQAHVISRQFENSTPKSNFECDVCNIKFSTYEDDLSSYFLLDKALLGISKKRRKGRGFPTLKVNGNTLISIDEKLSSLDESDPKQKSLKELLLNESTNLVVIQQDENAEYIKIEDNSIHYSLPRRPYYPINVFRGLLKMGLSLLKEEEVKDYKYAFDILQREKEEVLNHPYHHFLAPFSYIPLFCNLFNPAAIRLYKRRETRNDLVDKVFVLYFGNTIVQIPILSDKNLTYLINEKGKLKFFRIHALLNPFLSEELFKEEHKAILFSFFNVKRWEIDFSSLELKTDDIHKLTVSQSSNFVELS